MKWRMIIPKLQLIISYLKGPLKQGDISAKLLRRGMGAFSGK